MKDPLDTPQSRLEAVEARIQKREKELADFATEKEALEKKITDAEEGDATHGVDYADRFTDNRRLKDLNEKIELHAQSRKALDVALDKAKDDIAWAAHDVAGDEMLAIRAKVHE